jgi:hypothetical protein
VGEGDAAELDEAEVGRIFREESGRSLAALISVFGDIDLAEDAMQEAFAAALRKWPGDGVPPNPGGWITTVPADGRLDRIRLVATGANGHPALAAYLPAADTYRAYGVMVLVVAGDRVQAITGFQDASLFGAFGISACCDRVIVAPLVFAALSPVKDADLVTALMRRHSSHAASR